MKYSRQSKVIKKFTNIKPSRIVNATVSRDSNNHWYVSLLIECENQAQYQENNNIVGIDLGIKNNYTIVYNQDNELNHYIFDNPKGLAKYENKLARLQRKLSKRVRGSNNYNKLKLKIGKLHFKIKSIRRNFNHLISKRLISSFQVISIEDLDIKKMMMDKKHIFGKKLSDLAFYQLRTFLTYKCKWYGRNLSIADRYLSSSKICSSCGYKNTKLTLKDRDWTCPNCNDYHDRDVNAAKNLYGTGLISYNTGKYTHIKDSELIALIAS
jgi:putative transposase